MGEAELDLDLSGEQQQWELVAQLADELAERRRAREGRDLDGAEVVSLDGVGVSKPNKMVEAQ
ncbi:MAG: hypothetical protein DRI90_27595 [Deltaproteobacteria bacterium]|nr:MAG: hypothetical protein DRI90_27595 [Deltaproteobacteria bacterium]